MLLNAKSDLVAPVYYVSITFAGLMVGNTMECHNLKSSHPMVNDKQYIYLRINLVVILSTKNLTTLFQILSPLADSSTFCFIFNLSRLAFGQLTDLASSPFLT